MSEFQQRVSLGRSGLQVSRLGLGSSFSAPTASYLEAFEHGVNYFYWGSVRRRLMGDAIREIARRQREDLVVVVQSYSRWGRQLRGSVDKAVRKLGIDYADVLLLGWHNKPPSPAILEAALELRERGRVRHLALSSHRRTLFPTLLDDADYAIWHLRYNACHRGAEREVFPFCAERSAAERPGMVTYTTTRWGHLCDPARTPAGDRTPTGTDCYRFALTHPAVDLCLAGPDDAEQMKQALAALQRGPLDAEEVAWMQRVGDHIYGADRSSGLRDGAGAVAN